jgi:ABC-type multidrug transport system fused ATPase/permease subunit
MRVQLPVADAAAVRRYARRLLGRHPGALTRVVVLHGFAALAGLVTPFLLGRLIGAIEHGTTVSAVDGIALALVVFVLVQALLTRFAAFSSATLGERVLAELREEFVDRVLAIPLSTVERAGTGDLVTRTSRDVAQLSHSVRRGVPETLIAIITLVLTAGALIWLSPLLALPCLVGAPIIIGGARWYLRRAPTAYLRENAASSEVIDGLTETFDGARTTEALRTGGRRIARTDADLH